MRLTAVVENKSGKGQGMAVAILGLPGGLTLPEDMRQLKDTGPAARQRHEAGLDQRLGDPRPRAGAVLARPGAGAEDRGQSGPDVPRAGRVPRSRQPGVPVLQRRPQVLGRAAGGRDRAQGGRRPPLHDLSFRVVGPGGHRKVPLSFCPRHPHNNCMLVVSRNAGSRPPQGGYPCSASRPSYCLRARNLDTFRCRPDRDSCPVRPRSDRRRRVGAVALRQFQHGSALSQGLPARRRRGLVAAATRTSAGAPTGTGGRTAPDARPVRPLVPAERGNARDRRH